MLKMKKSILVTLVLMAIAMASVTCGCGVSDAPRSTPSVAAASISEIEDEAVPTSGPAVAASKPGNDSDGSDKDSDKDSGKKDYSTIESISGIMGLKADVESAKNIDLCVVFTEDEHNPYDVVWDYGKDYRKFVKAVDEAGMWDVLFDIDFYTEHYPMLALLYHDDEDLLLEHFQTVGVHEGRQGSDAFNVAAYMENCDSRLIETFGENYECYYFYWALNQDSESGIDAQSDGHPIQMTVKLTAVQSRELKKVNEYRDEVNADPVAIDPEFLAFANYRAWLDFTGDYQAHDWFDSHHDELTRILKSIGATRIGENTVYGEITSAGPYPIQYYSNYRNSKEHYNTMVSTDYTIFACSNTYWGPDDNPAHSSYGYKYCQYDLYLNRMDSYQIGEQ